VADPGIFVSVGSNIDPEVSILRGMELLARLVTITGISTFYETEPVGPPGQPAFVNGAVRIETDLAAPELKFGVLRHVEEALGRHRGADKYAPRTLDLDLVLYRDVVADEDGLALPDPDLLRRSFVALPVTELGGVLPGPAPLDDGRLRPLLDLTARLRETIVPRGAG
jgi:2-amino-4-hydroxy-6-hydroxymethyldihydropteridine diphosphokinase